MIELGLLRTKTSFDIAEAFAISELSKGQTEELIPAGKIFDVLSFNQAVTVDCSDFLGTALMHCQAFAGNGC
jgi:hypothetical protein